MRVHACLVYALAAARGEKDMRVHDAKEPGDPPVDTTVPAAEAPTVADVPAVEGENPEEVVTQVSEEVDELHKEVGALSDGTEEVRENANTLQGQTQVDMATNRNVQLKYEAGRSVLNGVSQQLKLESAPGFDMTAAALNEVQADVDKKQAEAEEMKAEIEAFEQNFANVKIQINDHIAREEGVCSNMKIWQKHVEPIMDTEDRAIKEADAWIDHLEGEMNKISSMLVRISEDLTGEGVDIVTEMEKEEMEEAESGKSHSGDDVKAD